MPKQAQNSTVEEAIVNVMKASAKVEELFKPVLAASLEHERAFMTLCGAVVCLIDAAKTNVVKAEAINKVQALLKLALEVVGAERPVVTATPPQKTVEPRAPALTSMTPMIDEMIKRTLEGIVRRATLPSENRDILRLYLYRETNAGDDKRSTAAYRKVTKLFHLTRPEPNRSLGCFVARGNGKFRPEMYARLLSGITYQEELAKELSVFYGEKNGAAVLACAQKTRYWQNREEEE